MEKTDRSGVWFFRGAFQGKDLFSSLAVSGDWVKKGSYHTAWSVPGDSSCSCSYAYGHGTAVGPHGEAVLDTALVVVECYRSPNEALVC